MSLDVQLFSLLNYMVGQSPFFDTLVIFFAEYLPYLLIALFLFVLFFTQYSRYEQIRIFAVAAISTLIARFGITELIRLFYNRPRPFLTLPAQQLFAESSWSFPSGHATFFFALSTVVYMYNKKWGIGFFVATALISIARVMAGVHYPSDIVGGMIIGIATAYFFVRYVGPKIRV